MAPTGDVRSGRRTQNAAHRPPAHLAEDIVMQCQPIYLLASLLIGNAAGIFAAYGLLLLITGVSI